LRVKAEKTAEEKLGPQLEVNCTYQVLSIETRLFILKKPWDS